MAVYLKGWKVGMKTVSAIRCLYEYSTESLLEAMLIIEGLFDGKTYKLSVKDGFSEQEFKDKLESYGTVVEIV